MSGVNVISFPFTTAVPEISDPSMYTDTLSSLVVSTISLRPARVVLTALNASFLTLISWSRDWIPTEPISTTVLAAIVLIGLEIEVE